jgi:hypothetical protein
MPTEADAFCVRPMRPHSDQVNVRHAHRSISTGVISHTSHFHEHADVGDWLLFVQKASYAGHGRGVRAWFRFYSERRPHFDVRTGQHGPPGRTGNGLEDRHVTASVRFRISASGGYVDLLSLHSHASRLGSKLLSQL